MFSIFKYDYYNKWKRQSLSETEIFFYCCSLMEQSNFSHNLSYFSYKRRKSFAFHTKIRNSCVVSRYNRSVLSRFTVSRHVFLRKVLTGSMPGFYKSAW